MEEKENHGPGAPDFCRTADFCRPSRLRAAAVQLADRQRRDLSGKSGQIQLL
ncbi:hypothetical protein [Caproicibacter fermentans]|uniref:Uncharacterized protein n=1 Tax=Caproicibacter fermentans TaxID=2576756 RepID=A0A7G8T7U3_9FIRM|nr:hypothetical protein [Caproicibacter fermentans]QNK39684.1 hypothetical protein HCR03_13220 [Caproicibacter fermentans]